MENIIGQKQLLEKINNMNVLPHSFSLIGNVGSGKHIIANYINDKFFNLPHLDITEHHEEEDLDNIYRYPQKRLYILDINKITQKEQNKLLKFIEEPFENIYVCLLVTDKNLLLPTIKNRIISYSLDEYTKEELICFKSLKEIDVDTKYILTVLKTPGDLLKIKSNNVDLNKIEELCDKIVTKMTKASFPNTLSIIDKINFKDEYDKFDLDFFLRILTQKYFDSYIDKRENDSYNYFMKIVETKKKITQDSRLDKKKLITSLLIDIWKGEHRCN